MNNSYPNLKQSFGLFGIYIGISILLALMVAGMPQMPGVFLSTLLINALVIAFALQMQEQSINFLFENGQPVKPAVIFEVILFTTAFIAVIDPLVSLIPMPKAFEEMMMVLFKKNIWVFLSVSFVAPVTEELLFRKIILTGLAKSYGVKKGILWSAFFFALFHLNPWQGISAFLIGIFLGWLYIKTQNIWLTIFIHFFNNTLAFALFFFTDDAQVTLTDFIGSGYLFWLIILLSLICMYVCIRLLRKQFENYHNPWKEDPEETAPLKL